MCHPPVVIVTEYLVKTMSGRRGFILIQFEGTVYHGGEDMEQEPEAAGHAILAARKQRELNTGA